MSLRIEIEDNMVLLSYFPEQIGPDNYLKLIEEKESRRIYNTFYVTDKDYYKIDLDDIYFVIGEEEKDYFRIYKHVLSTERDYCFDKTISLSKKDFVAARKTSVIQMLDEMIDTSERTIYIDKNVVSDKDNHICYDEYRRFQKAIPHEAELKKYIWMRAAVVFRGVFTGADRLINNHEKWIDYVEKKVLNNNVYEKNVADLDYLRTLDYRKLIEVRNQLQHFIINCDAYHESTFQKAISEVVRFIFPKYLYAIREIRFKGFDLYEKQPDFVLIDYNGMIDFMEIKKPSVKLINKTLYRNNYSPSHELSGATQQVEKYIACIQRIADEWESSPPKKIMDCLPNTLNIKIINPQGLIIMGDASGFDLYQKKDFELIKRQYKHVAEIITYDDLLNRLDNMINALAPYMKK